MYPIMNLSKQLSPMLDTKKRDKTETNIEMQKQVVGHCPW